MAVLCGGRISLAVCDDDGQDLQKISAMAEKLLTEQQAAYQISRFSGPEQLLDKISQGETFDIFLLDVMMEGQTGMELASTLRKQGNGADIIFLSSNREMALMGYEVDALRYLSKPVQQEKLQEALLCALRRKGGQKEILLPTPEGQRRILVSDIVYIEPWARGAKVVLSYGSCVTSVKISEMEQILPKERFAFCHRTVLVNLAFIESVRYCELTLKNGQVLPVSKYRQAQLRESLMRYLRD